MIREILKKYRNAAKKKKWDDFVREQSEKSVRRKPKRVGVPENMRGTLFAIRNKRLAIREAALRHVSIIVTYTKITDGTTKLYEVNPVEWKYKKLKNGYRKVLYVYDKNDNKQIKNFVLRNIGNVIITDRKFVPFPGYPVKIK